MKILSTVSDLAIFGAPPLFSTPLHVGLPNIGDRQLLFELLAGALDRRRLTNDGPLVQQLERNLESFLQVKHVVATCNGTLALQIAASALALRGQVILPSFTFVATAHALQWQGITPVFADIDPRTHNLDPLAVEAAITDATTAIIGVHVWGRPCQIEALQELADLRKLHLVFDAAHAFGSSHRGRMIGGFGSCEVFSFHATKTFNTFEGGAIATNNAQLAEKLRAIRNFGFCGFDEVRILGTNAKMPEFAAAAGLTNLLSFDTFVAANRRNYERYSQGVANIPGLRLIEYSESERHNFQYVVAELDEEQFGMSRDALYAALHAENILARRYFFPGCHRMAPYNSLYPRAGETLPNTETLSRHVLTFPTGALLTEDSIDQVCDVVRFCREHAAELDVAEQRL